MSTLVIIPCGKAKVWDKNPALGAVAAKDAYNGTPFRTNLAYAEATGNRWMILSAKYGFIEPDFSVPETYNVKFGKRATKPISVEELRIQADAIGLTSYARVVVLGGIDYRTVVQQTFLATGTEVECPFEGAPNQGTLTRNVRRATEAMKR